MKINEQNKSRLDSENDDETAKKRIKSAPQKQKIRELELLNLKIENGKKDKNRKALKKKRKSYTSTEKLEIGESEEEDLVNEVEEKM